MMRIEGKEPEVKDPSKPSEDQIKLDKEVAKIEKLGCELKGIASSISALIGLFRDKLDSGITDQDQLIKQPPSEYHNVFKADLGKLDELI